MEKVCQEFSVALYNLIMAMVSEMKPRAEEPTRVGVVGLCPPSEEKPVVEVKAEEPVKKEKAKKTADKWPKSFAAWVGAREDDWKKMACTEWRKEKVKFIVPAALHDFVEESIGEVTDELRGLSGNKEIEIITVKKEEPKKPTEAKAKSTITADSIKTECAKLATKMKSKDKVIAIIKQFGATKVDEVDPAQYPAMMAAVTAALETSNQTSENADGF